MRQRLLASIVPGVLVAVVAVGCGSDDSSPAAAPSPPAATSTPGATVSPTPSATPSAAPTTTATVSPSPQGSPNGVETLAAAEIVKRARRAAREATSVHVSGTSSQGGTKVSIDARMDERQGTGTVETGGGRIGIVRSGKTVYVQGDTAFYTSVVGDANTAKLLEGKWLKSSTSNRDFRELAALVDYDRFVGEGLEPAGEATKADTKGIDGIRAVGLHDRDGVLYVALDGEPLPVAAEPTPGSGEGRLRFSEWSAPVEVTVPKASETIDLAELNRAR